MLTDLGLADDGNQVALPVLAMSSRISGVSPSVQKMCAGDTKSAPEGLS